MSNRDWVAEYAAARRSDISEHLLYLYDECVGFSELVEIGVREGESTKALLATGAHLTSIDLGEPPKLNLPFPTNWTFVKGDSREVEPPSCDALLIDSGHTYDLTLMELRRFAPKVRTVIFLHDTVSKPGVMQAMETFLKEGAGWMLTEHHEYCNGLGVLSRA